MNIYTLDNKEQDKLFLAKQPISGKAVVQLDEVDSMNPGHEIVVQLSNRSKYKGVILDYKYKAVNGKAEGELKLIRK